MVWGSRRVRYGLRGVFSLRARAMLQRRLDEMALAASDSKLRGRIEAFADVLMADGRAFKLAKALSNVFAGTGQPAS